MKKTLFITLVLVLLVAFLCSCGSQPSIQKQLQNAEVRDYVTFGSYEQDNKTSNGAEPVEWRVLEIKDGRALLISKYALDFKPYHTSFTDITWEDCSLRKWLNNDFINTAFTEEEKAMIPTVTVSADTEADWATDPGNDTQDKVFLLSVKEAKQYFSINQVDRQCEPTEYAEAMGAYSGNDIWTNTCNWYLRSTGANFQFNATEVFSSGEIFDASQVHLYLAIRPALWVDLNA